MLYIKCKYALSCAAYRDDSYTCTIDSDKYYCGIYRQFICRAIKINKIKRTLINL